MSDREKSFSFLNGLKQQFNRIDKGNENYIIELIKEVSSFYLFVENIRLKMEIIDEYCKYISKFIKDEKILNSVKFILSKNILLENADEIILTKWIFINDFIIRKEYLLLNKHKKYEVRFLKEFPIIKYDEMY